MTNPNKDSIKNATTAQLQTEGFQAFMEFIQKKKMTLYPAQEEAILELFDGRNVILNTPTGSGKSLVAIALHFYSRALKRRSIYTSPIKALVNEKFLNLCASFSPHEVGMITGDATINPSAPIICCTAEILSHIALREGEQLPFHDIIMDEFHYYSDRDRGVAWQIPLLICAQSRFLLMSATLGDTTFFEESLTRLTGKKTVRISSIDRPVPLFFEYSEKPLQETILSLLTLNRAPIYLVHFTQRECADTAQNLLSIDICTRDEKKLIAQEIQGIQFSSPYGKEVQKLLKHGIGIHHAGLLPKYRIWVEKLAQKGMLKIICGTDTLGVGVNIPIRTVLFTQLCKFNGNQTSILSVRDFHQISGRAGRKGFDSEGYVIAQAPAHVIENLRLEQKAAGDPKKLRKFVKRKPPEKGFIHWNQETFTRLIQSQPEPLVSQLRISHSMLLHVLGRPDGTGCDGMRQLIRDSHESAASKRQHRKRAFQLFRALVDRHIIELNPLRIPTTLQEDFSLNQTLSLYLIDTIQALDHNHPEYGLHLLSVVESILENPDVILRKQLDRIKTEKMQQMKEEGLEYDERIAELEKLEYPKPLRDFIYSTFNEFSAKHPWLGEEYIRPKSVAREMYETFQSFSEYIRDYQVHRSEGILLRYLTEVYKTLVQTVPNPSKTEQVDAIIVYLESMLKEVDSSLLAEWEQMQNSDTRKKSEKIAATTPQEDLVPVTSSREIQVKLKNEIFRLVRAFSRKDYEQILHSIQPQSNTLKLTWDTSVLETRMKAFEEEHSCILTSPGSRRPHYTHIVPIEGLPLSWDVQQILVDPEDFCDWELHCTFTFDPIALSWKIGLNDFRPITSP